MAISDTTPLPLAPSLVAYRGIVVDENTPRPPWESRQLPEPEVVNGKVRGTKPKEILVKVDLD